MKGAGVLSLAAALVHGGLTSAHFEEWWGYGAFFLGVTLAQAVLGLALLTDAFEARRDVLAMLVTGIVGNLLVVAMYVISRTTGIPLVGPDAGEVEARDPLGVGTTLAEVATALLLAYALVAILRNARTAAP
ncbi:MAG TPA: hypothetical protein VM370_05945 [Candidatus Thermoplasmatota archaeon]|nr:hypothetical protein [Candidatus Thermoplasmatota archaeon]